MPPSRQHRPRLQQQPVTMGGLLGEFLRHQKIPAGARQPAPPPPPPPPALPPMPNWRREDAYHHPAGQPPRVHLTASQARRIRKHAAREATT